MTNSIIFQWVEIVVCLLPVKHDVFSENVCLNDREFMCARKLQCSLAL